MKRTTLMIIATLAAAAGPALAVTACSGEARQHHHGSSEKAYQYLTYRVDDALDDLEANDEQRAKVNTVKDRLFEKAVAVRKEGRDARKAALAELKTEKPDAQKLHSLLDERIEAFRAVGHEAVDAAVELHGVLTPEQRAELLARIEERMLEHEEDDAEAE